MDRFLLAENPLKMEREYILHTVEPKCLIEVTGADEIERLKHVLKRPNKRAYVLERTNERFILSLADQHDQTEWTEERFAAIADRAFRWFVNYLNQEDHGIDESKKARSN